MSITPVEVWLVVGIVFILMEFTQIPGIGLLFLGFGAISTSVIIYYFPETVDYQFISVGFASLAWFLVLWWPLKAFVYNKKKDASVGYFDIVGMQVEVISEDIKAGGLGQVYWSGTTMNARLADANAVAKVGDRLYVLEVKGNTLICSL